MKRSALLVALSAASLAGSVAFAQTYGAGSDAKPSTGTRPETTTTKPAMADQDFSMTKLDTNKDGLVDKTEARASASLSAVFDKADTNRDGKLDAAELSAAASASKAK